MKTDPNSVSINELKLYIKEYITGNLTIDTNYDSDNYYKVVVSLEGKEITSTLIQIQTT